MASQTSNLSRKELAINDLIAEIARALVDHPEGVQVRAVEGSYVTVLELKTHPEDLGRVIRRQERTAETMRTLFGAAGVKLHKRFTLEILDLNAVSMTDKRAHTDSNVPRYVDDCRCLEEKTG